MKVLIIGSGGREHAICQAFRRSPRVEDLFCANGNAGISQIAECVPIDPNSVNALAVFAEANKIGLTFVGGETPLALGIVDEFERRGLRIIGPTHVAAQLESSKVFAKNFMDRHSIPTAKYYAADTHSAAVEKLNSGEFGSSETPIVVKADGLAAGKGVVMAANRSEAITAINEMADLVGDTAASKIVLEECLKGREVSLIMFANGDDFALMPSTRDHKRIGEGDTGPNTGGMGTFTDASLLSDQQLDEIKETIIRPTLKGCVSEGFPFRGVLFLGLMITADGPQVLEYNVRFGDPETQSILIRLKTDIAEICEVMLDDRDGGLNDLTIDWRSGNSACVVLASENYPAKPRIGDPITGVASASSSPNVEVFHSGTSLGEDGKYHTSGGRVLGVTAVGDTLKEALDRAYEAVREIHFEGMQYRPDIGK